MEKKKSLGQHFLKSKSALDKILSVSNVYPSDIVLEIGPGEGVLTLELLKLCKKVIAVEKDHRLIPFLSDKFKKEIEAGKLEIIEQDVLEFSTDILPSSYKLIANIPYYITGQILRMFLENKKQPGLMTLLVQKEVAERAVAKPVSQGGDGKESLLSISVKAYGDPYYGGTVPRGAFVPHPNVDSAILVIENISRERLQGADEELFWKILHLGFSHKRKQLIANLSPTFGREKLLKLFEKLSIPSTIRAEDVPLKTWIIFCNTINT